MTTINTGVNIAISWQYPDDQSDTITHYAIEFRHSDGVTYSEDPDCDGTDPFIMSARTCVVPIRNLREAPFNLQFDEFVFVRVNSYNSFG